MRDGWCEVVCRPAVEMVGNPVVAPVLWAVVMWMFCRLVAVRDDSPPRDAVGMDRAVVGRALMVARLPAVVV